MELSPACYRLFVRPKCISHYFFHHITNCIDFSGSVILDFGCGIGSGSVMFPAAEYIGLDCDCKRIAYAKRLYPNHKFLTSKGFRIPLPDKAVDYINFLSVIHHIPDRHLIMYFKEFRRILKDGGRIIIAEPCFFKNSHICNRFMLYLDKGKYIRNEKEYLNLLKAAEYRTAVKKRFRQFLFYNKILITAET